MTASSTLKREARVAFSRRAQPVWFRVLKWAVLISLGVLYWRAPLFWMCLFAALIVGLAMHLFWRWKTKGWTQPWGGWSDVETANKE